MALTKTLAQMRSDLKIRAGMNSTGTSVDLTSTVLDGIINDAVYEGWDVITGKWLDYFTTSSSQAVTSGTDSYTVPTDFYKLRAVWMLDGSRYIRLLPADLDAAHLYTGQTVGTKAGYRYRLMGRSLYLMPTPSANETLRIYYIPIKTEMTSDSDSVTFDVPIEYKYILAIAWRDLLDRQNLDPSPAIAKADAYEKKLRTAADGRDAGEPFYLNPRGPVNDDDDWPEVF